MSLAPGTKPIAYYRDQYGTHPIFDLSNDSDKLDGLHAVSFPKTSYKTAAELNNNTTLESGIYTCSDGAGLGLEASWYHIINMHHFDNNGYNTQIACSLDGYHFMWIRFSAAGTWSSWYKIYHADNDGSGSGLDADLVDGQHASVFVPTSRQIIAGVGLSGGGDLTIDRTLTVAIPTLYIEDQKAANTAGGTFTSGAWQKRDLNTVVTNEITGASLASSQITLPAGTYEARFSCPAFAVSRHKAKLYNVTASANIILGSSEDSPPTGSVDKSFGFGRFTLAVQSVLELRHQCQITYATYGLGVESNFAVIEVYSQIEIRKIA